MQQQEKMQKTTDSLNERVTELESQIDILKRIEELEEATKAKDDS